MLAQVGRKNTIVVNEFVLMHFVMRLVVGFNDDAAGVVAAAGVVVAAAAADDDDSY